MNKERRLTKPEQYNRVYNEGSSCADKFLVLKATPNHLGFSRYGISVSKRVGNAVTRNRVKRVLREILRSTSLMPGWDIILIARSLSSTSDYSRLYKSTADLLARMQLK